MTTWLLAVALVLLADAALIAIASGFAVATGLSVDRAVRLIVDPSESPLATSSTWIAVTILASELSVASALAIGLKRSKIRLSAVAPFGRPRAKAFLSALLLVFALAPCAELVAELVYRLLSREIATEQAVLVLARDSSAAGFLLVLVVSSLVPALVEESLFRGFLFAAFQRLGKVTCLVLTSVLFGALHLEPTQAAATAVLGLAFGLARMYSNSVAPAMLAHALYNAAVMISVRLNHAPDAHDYHVDRALIGLLVAGLVVWRLERDRREALS